MIVASPLKLAAGVKTISLFTILTDPSELGTTAVVIVRGCPFGSVSLAKTSTAIEPASSSIVAVSAWAEGMKLSNRIFSISENSSAPAMPAISIVPACDAGFPPT